MARSPIESIEPSDDLEGARLSDIRPGHEAPPQRKRFGGWWVLLSLLLASAAAWWWWKGRAVPPAPVAAPVVTSVPVPAAAPPASAVLTAPSAQAAAPEPQPVATAIASAADVRSALTELMSAKGVSTWLQLDEFPRRVVSTVDNLGREQATSRLWPVNPTGGRFTVVDEQGRKTINPDNAKRYAPMVQVFESIDTAAMASLYVRMLPTLQRAYEEIGFPQRRFHTRVIEVIDHLVAAPAPSATAEVRLTEVRGEIPSTRPWVRYEYVDPALESASAGHKLMLRIGADHQRRVKTKLKALRAELVQQAR
jgi:Protein of unknown function (DUF3014)